MGKAKRRRQAAAKQRLVKIPVEVNCAECGHQWEDVITAVPANDYACPACGANAPWQPGMKREMRRQIRAQRKQVSCVNAP